MPNKQIRRPIGEGRPITAREAGALSAIDAVSSLGAVPLETDSWGLDAVASGAQKALMTPPGLAMVTASGAAWERAGEARSPRFYWDWEKTRKGQATLDAPVTPPVYGPSPGTDYLFHEISPGATIGWGETSWRFPDRENKAFFVVPLAAAFSERPRCRKSSRTSVPEIDAVRCLCATSDDSS